MLVRLVSFLGTGNYQETTYTWQREEGRRECRTRFVARALAEMTSASEVLVLATKDAWAKHGDEFVICLNEFGLRPPDRDGFLPLGATPEELWKQFQLVKSALRAPEGTKIVLDITHGFRSQPFFAAAAVGFTRLVDPRPAGLQVVYGAFEAGDKVATPIWDITPFVELLDWSRSLMLFLRTGRAAELALAVDSLGRALRKSWYTSGRHGPQPRIDSLAKALRRFGNDIETVRTGAILLGRPPDESSAVAQLLGELQRSKEELPRYIPPLADVLDRLQETVEGLRTGQRLSQPEGLKALKALASLYLEMGRYPEAAATLREAWINRHACSLADCPGLPEFSEQHREAAERAWYAANEQLAGEIAETRNDIQHAGYRSCPQPAETIKRKIDELIRKLPVEEETDA